MNTPDWTTLWSVADLLTVWGLSSVAAVAIEAILRAILIVVVATLANGLARQFIIRVVHRFFYKTRVTWDDPIADRGVLLRLSRIAPALIFYSAADFLIPGIGWIAEMVRRVAAAWIVVAAARTVDAVINVFHDLYRERKVDQRRPIKGFIQLGKVALLIVAVVVVLTTLLDQSPVGILSGLGAMSAVLLLVFRDAILGFVSGVQLSANNMVQIGDWIEMPKYEADGTVVDITLQTIKVQNWDKTFTTIPIYALVSDSFKNWRGMDESGGRRIKRAINIDMRSVRFVTPEMLERYRRFARLRRYLNTRQAEIDAYNQEHHIDLTDTVSGRRMTNLGVFRAYIAAYLQEHPQINHEMTFLIRHLAPRPTGIPIEIFVFSRDKRWPVYEEIQADIFDHLLAVVPEFDLRVFQEPSGYDMEHIARAIQGSGAPVLETGSPTAE